MKFNARCWRRPDVVPLIAMLLLSGCAMGDSEVHAPCPPVVDYSVADQSRAVAEVDALPNDAMVMQMLIDYAVMRDQARACR